MRTIRPDSPSASSCRRIDLIDGGIHDAPGQEVDPGDVRACRQGTRQLDDILGLAARVRIAAQLEPLGPDEPVNTDEYEVEAVIVHWNLEPFIADLTKLRKNDRRQESPPAHPS